MVNVILYYCHEADLPFPRIFQSPGRSGVSPSCHDVSVPSMSFCWCFPVWLPRATTTSRYSIWSVRKHRKHQNASPCCQPCGAALQSSVGRRPEGRISRNFCYWKQQWPTKLTTVERNWAQKGMQRDGGIRTDGIPPQEQQVPAHISLFPSWLGCFSSKMQNHSKECDCLILGSHHSVPFWCMNIDSVMEIQVSKTLSKATKLCRRKKEGCCFDQIVKNSRGRQMGTELLRNNSVSLEFSNSTHNFVTNRGSSA